MILEKALRNLDTIRQTFSSQESRNDRVANKTVCESWWEGFKFKSKPHCYDKFMYQANGSWFWIKWTFGVVKSHLNLYQEPWYEN